MFDLPEKVTVWTETSNDGEGNRTYAHEIANARHADIQKMITDKHGKSYMSKAAIYLRSDTVSLKSIVKMGGTEALTPPDDADEVMQLANTPSGAGNLFKLWL